MQLFSKPQGKDREIIMVFAKTDIGKARELNQDYYYISQETDEPKVYILADGMGRI